MQQRCLMALARLAAGIVCKLGGLGPSIADEPASPA
jgi:hypothetical protein